MKFLLKHLVSGNTFIEVDLPMGSKGYVSLNSFKKYVAEQLCIPIEFLRLLDSQWQDIDVEFLTNLIIEAENSYSPKVELDMIIDSTAMSERTRNIMNIAELSQDNDIILVMEELEQSPNLLCTASSAIKSNEKIMLFAIRLDFRNFQYASDELKKSEEFMMKAMKKHINVFELFLPEFKDNIEFVINACEKNQGVYHLIKNDSVRENPDVQRAANISPDRRNESGKGCAPPTYRRF